MKVKPRDLLNFFLIFGGWKCRESKVVLVAIYLVDLWNRVELTVKKLD
jgi:hypothetical protein